MNAIEIRLAGKEASLNHIIRTINRQLGLLPVISRVELRYSSQSENKLAPQMVKDSIAKLLREHGLGQAAVSVRPHAGPIDDASGEHLLRLHHAEPKEAPPHTPRPGVLRLWLARVFPHWFAVAPAATAAGAANTSQAQATRKTPTLTNPQAVDYLRRAVAQAADYMETQTNTAIDTTSNQVREARIVVRLDELHAVLGPMLQGQANAVLAAQSIGDMLRAKGLSVAPTFSVGYAFEPHVETIGTSLASETDLQVVLHLALNASNASIQPIAPKNTQRVEPTLETAFAADIPTQTLAPDTTTALPAANPPTTAPTAALTVRVLGTLAAGQLQAFEKVFELHYATLPARFDRNALVQAGFGARHPELVQVASNSCPLTLERAPDGGLRTHATSRPSTNGQTAPGTSTIPSIPMYYRAESLAPLGQHDTVSANTRLVVNAPGGVIDRASARTLPALVVELACL
ncbi:MAG: hypothetical protein IPH35_10505 [Rhodoferax sp.]|nr:hypothetical protein [Rhodoferax sp.]